MANLGFLKRLITEDFDKKDQTLVGGIASVINPAFEALVQALNKGLNITDLNTQLKDIELVVDASGNPVNATSFRSELRGNCTGVVVVRAQNLTNSSVYPSAAPFVSFAQDSGQIIIQNVKGLQSGSRYRLRLLALV